MDHFPSGASTPGHCTGELGFAILLDRFKERFQEAGLGAVIVLP